MPRLSRQMTQQQTRERLLEAARKEIIRRGVATASIRNISEAAGYSLGAFYSNFPNKEAMLHELQDLHMREELRVFRDIVADTEQGNMEEVLAKISDWLRKLQKNEELSALELEFQLYASRNPSFKKKCEEDGEKKEMELAEGLKTLFARWGLAPKIDPLQMAVGFAALWIGFAVQGNAMHERSSEEIIMVFLKALLDGAMPIGTTGPRQGDRQES